MTHSTFEHHLPHRHPALAWPRHVLGSLVFTLALGCGDDAAPTYASWAASPQDYAEQLPFPGAAAPEPLSFDDQTLRQLIHVSQGGDALRVQLSNLFGDSAVSIDAAGVALATGGGSIDPSSHVALTFGGSPRVTLAAGEERWSDYVSFALAPEADIAVSLHVEVGPVRTVHSLGQQTAHLAAGDFVSAATLPTGSTQQSYFWLSRVDVRGSVAPRVVVAFGDSITDGFNSTPDVNHRYPNYLSARLANGASGEYSVVNAGISGNRVLSDVIGPSAVSRFRRDVLGQTGVTDTIILIGINDIGFSGLTGSTGVGAEQITGGLNEMVDAANAAGVRVHLATLLPFEGTNAPYYSEAGEAERQAVNAWVRANTHVATVVDFDRAMQDPANPAAMLPAYDSGDHLHPNDVGYSSMADSIDVASFD